MAGLCDFADEVLTAGATAAGACEQGTRFTKRISYSAGGDPLPLTDMAIRMQVRDLDGTLVLDLALGTGIEIVDADAGIFEIDLGATVTAALPFNKIGFDYDLELVPAGVEDDAFALLRGMFLVIRQVTREEPS